MPDWFSIALDKGFTLGFAVAVLFGFARAAKFLAPKVTQVVESHAGLIESLKTNGRLTSECLQRQGDRQEAMDEKLTAVHERVVIGRCQSGIPPAKG